MRSAMSSAPCWRVAMSSIGVCATLRQSTSRWPRCPPTIARTGAFKVLIDAILKRNAPVYVEVKPGEAQGLAAELKGCGFSLTKTEDGAELYKWEPVAKPKPPEYRVQSVERARLAPRSRRLRLARHNRRRPFRARRHRSSDADTPPCRPGHSPHPARGSGVGGLAAWIASNMAACRRKMRSLARSR